MRRLTTSLLATLVSELTARGVGAKRAFLLRNCASRRRFVI